MLIYSEEETREEKAHAEILLAEEIPVKDGLVQETGQVGREKVVSRKH